MEIRKVVLKEFEGSTYSVIFLDNGFYARVKYYTVDTLGQHMHHWISKTVKTELKACELADKFIIEETD